MKQNILQSWNDQWPVVCSTTPLPTGAGVVDSVTISVAEECFITHLKLAHLDNGEGRFNTELKRTKDIF